MGETVTETERTAERRGIMIPYQKKERIYIDPDNKKVLPDEIIRIMIIGALLYPLLCILIIYTKNGFLILDEWNIILLLLSPVIGVLSLSLLKLGIDLIFEGWY